MICLDSANLKKTPSAPTGYLLFACLSFTCALDEYLLFACLFAIEYPECAACYFESLGFADHEQGK